MDKSEWERGPWDDEPDKVQWVDEATGLDCLIVRGPVGSLCGYVGVSKGHPAFERDYNSIDAHVHGGLSFSDSCQEGDPHGICHVPEPGRPEHVWWLGFDCAHCFDYSPAMHAGMKAIGFGLPYAGPSDRRIYRTLDFVRKECAQLAAQLAAMTNPAPCNQTA